MSARTKTVLRWIAVLPAALGAYAGVALLTVISQYFFQDSEIYGDFISAILSPAAFVFAGVKTAPQHKLITAISLTVLHAMLLALLFGFIAYGIFVMEVKLIHPILWDVIRAIISIVTTIAVCLEVAREYPVVDNSLAS
jgi:hypothetical protein